MDDRGRDGGTNFILRIKEQETRLNLHEHDDDDDDDDEVWNYIIIHPKQTNNRMISTKLQT